MRDRSRNRRDRARARLEHARVRGAGRDRWSRRHRPRGRPHAVVLAHGAVPRHVHAARSRCISGTVSTVPPGTRVAIHRSDVRSRHDRRRRRCAARSAHDAAANGRLEDRPSQLQARPAQGGRHPRQGRESAGTWKRRRDPEHHLHGTELGERVRAAGVVRAALAHRQAPRDGDVYGPYRGRAGAERLRSRRVGHRPPRLHSRPRPGSTPRRWDNVDLRVPGGVRTLSVLGRRRDRAARRGVRDTSGSTRC